MYEGRQDSEGRQLAAGLPLGSEPTWGQWLLGETESDDDDFTRYGLPNLRYVLFQRGSRRVLHLRGFRL